MKAISLQQPWAGLLVLGIKEFETRSWNTKFRGEIAVHASAKIPKEGETLLQWLGENIPDFKPGESNHTICTMRGVILGTVVVTDTFSTNDVDQPVEVEEIQEMFGDFSPNRYFWLCEHPDLFENPIPAKGALSIWNWDQESVPTL
jgi:hypothetical protein